MHMHWGLTIQPCTSRHSFGYYNARAPLGTPMAPGPPWFGALNLIGASHMYAQVAYVYVHVYLHAEHANGRG
jgi:hypothetical protein